MRFKAVLPVALSAALLTAGATQAAPAWTPPPGYQVEWVYRVRYGFEDEWWRLFRTYQIAQLDEQKRRGFVVGYVVERPSLHVSEESRWDYRIIITYRDRDATTHEAEVERDLFPDAAARKRDEARRWELTANHWDLPIHVADPHAAD